MIDKIRLLIVFVFCATCITVLLYDRCKWEKREIFYEEAIQMVGRMALEAESKTLQTMERMALEVDSRGEFQDQTVPEFFVKAPTYPILFEINSKGELSFFKDNEKIGELIYNGMWSFRGDVDESAQVFFDTMILLYYRNNIIPDD